MEEALARYFLSHDRVKLMNSSACVICVTSARMDAYAILSQALVQYECCLCLRGGQARVAPSVRCTRAA